MNLLSPESMDNRFIIASTSRSTCNDVETCQDDLVAVILEFFLTRYSSNFYILCETMAIHPDNYEAREIFETFLQAISTREIETRYQQIFAVALWLKYDLDYIRTWNHPGIPPCTVLQYAAFFHDFTLIKVIISVGANYHINRKLGDLVEIFLYGHSHGSQIRAPDFSIIERIRTIRDFAKLGIRQSKIDFSL